MKDDVIRAIIGVMLFTLTFFFILFTTGCSTATYAGKIAPNLVIIDYSLEEDIEYMYDEERDIFCFNQEDMDNLNKNIITLQVVIEKYEAEIEIYKKWRSSAD